MLAYLAGPFSGALMLFAESENGDVRFHAWQSIIGLGALGAALVFSCVLAIAALFLAAGAVSTMVGLAAVLFVVLLIAWAICLYQAYAGGRWKLPVAGRFAERRV